VLTSAAKSVWAGSSSRFTLELSISENMLEGFNKHFLEGIERVFITDSTVRHIMKSHSKDEEVRGQLNLEPEDFALIPVVLNEYDSIEMTGFDKLGNKRFLVQKLVEGEVFVATIQRGKRRWK